MVETELKTNPEDGTQKLVVEDAKPIVSVACEGMCIPTYGKLKGLVWVGYNADRWCRFMLRQQQPAPRAVLQRLLRGDEVPTLEYGELVMEDRSVFGYRGAIAYIFVYGSILFTIVWYDQLCLGLVGYFSQCMIIPL